VASNIRQRRGRGKSKPEGEPAGPVAAPRRQSRAAKRGPRFSGEQLSHGPGIEFADRRFRVRPVYLLVIEQVLSRINLDEIKQIGTNIDTIVKQRDAIVSQIYKIMFFLASLMIFIFLIEIKFVDPSEGFVSLKFKVADEGMFIFGFLLIGNIVALLFSSAMVKMFMLEFILKTYCWLNFDGPGRFIAGVAYRFYVFVFGLITEQNRAGIPRPISRIAGAIHLVTVVILPLSFIFAYCSVLWRALARFWAAPTQLPGIGAAPVHAQLLGIGVETWYFYVLVFFNLITLSFYAFAFFPCPVFPICGRRLQELTVERANELWELAGKPKGRDSEISLIAERQIRLRFHLAEQ
jgi:hypothetical protein